MADAPKPAIGPVVEIELDRPRTLRLDFAGIAAAERATGKSFLRPGAIVVAGANEMTAILWGCLLHEDPQLRLEDVRSWISYGNVNYVVERVMEAVVACFPEPDEDLVADGDDGASDPTATASQTGTKSGRSHASSSGSRRKSSGA